METINQFLNVDIPSLHQQYEPIFQIGEGKFGKVFRCRNRFTGKEFAIKIVSLNF
jgi:serine/threonine protein kinase